MAGKDEMVMRVVDDEMVRRYVSSGGCKCLFCGDNSIEGGSVEVDSGGANQEITCARCGGIWTDVHDLVGVVVEGHIFIKRDR
jgi:hypothetical protein